MEPRKESEMFPSFSPPVIRHMRCLRSWESLRLSGKGWEEMDEICFEHVSHRKVNFRHFKFTLQTSKDFFLSPACDSGLASQPWILFSYRAIHWWLQFLSVLCPVLLIVCNDALLALRFSLGPHGNPTSTDGETLLSRGLPREFWADAFERNLGRKRMCPAIVLGDWWDPCLFMWKSCLCFFNKHRSRARLVLGAGNSAPAFLWSHRLVRIRDQQVYWEKQAPLPFLWGLC